MSDMPTPPSGLRVEHDVRNEYANGIERLQTRLLHIGLFLLTVVMLGGGAGVLMVVTGESRTAAIAVVVGCAVAVLVALLVAMSATRQLTPLIRRPAPVVPARPIPMPAQQETARTTRHAEPAPSPLWGRPSEQQVTITDDPGQRREVFVKLARRLQSLINRAIKRIDELEQENEDPELLDGLYEIDHLFTLARRQGENLAVLGGEAPQRRSNRPVSVYAVLLAAVSEAEHYRQIAIVPVEDVEIHGHAVAEIIHLLAELLENATRFTSPDGPKVEVRAHKVTAGLAIEVQDRGLGMSYEDLDRINSLLDGSTRIDLSELLEDGRIGLAVVRELARRHDIRVRLQSNIFGGIAAAVVIPPQLLSEPRHRVPAPQQQSALPKRQPESANVLEESSSARTATLDRPVPSPTPRSPEPANPAERSGPIPVHGRQSSPAEQSGPRQSVAEHVGQATSRAERSGPITPVSEQSGPGRSTSPSERSGPIPAPGRASRAERSGSFPVPGRPASEQSDPSRPVSYAEQSGELDPFSEQAGPVQVPAPPPIPGRAAPSPAPRTTEPTSVPGAGRVSEPEQSGPIQVPAPTPIPAASVPSRAAATGTGRRRRAENDTATDLPALPVRAPGRAYEDLRASGVGGVTEETEEEQGEQPPPLPQRRGSHLREELLDPPAVTTPVPGHNTNLMKTVQAGRENWFAEQNRESTRGDSWPTT